MHRTSTNSRPAPVFAVKALDTVFAHFATAGDSVYVFMRRHSGIYV
ncbi:hypothetical protein HMPREF0577_1425 [Mobiluncus mulieris ATCC 35243]|nr:hypothetical protein HMPREF0577_1425 [Mobiluncus mulieris ATCC 35243]